MGVVSVTPSARGHSSSEPGQYTMVYTVTTDNQRDGPHLIREHFRSSSDLPFYGRIYRVGNDYDANSVCQSLNVEVMDQSRKLWLVTATWGPLGNAFPLGQSEGAGFSFNAPDEYDVDTQQITTVVEKAVYIKGFKGAAELRRPPGSLGPVENSAGVPFNPPLEREKSIRIVRITRWHQQWSGAAWNDWLNVVNADDVIISRPQYNFYEHWRPQQAILKRISAQNGYIQTGAPPAFEPIPQAIPAWRISWEFWIADSWRVDVLDRGIMKRHSDAFTYDDAPSPDKVAPQTQLTDEENNVLQEPVPFDGDGLPLGFGAEPVFITYAIYPEVSYNMLMSQIF